LRLEEGPLKRLDDFRFKHRFVSRTKAVRWLLDWALKAEAAREQKGG